MPSASTTGSITFLPLSERGVRGSLGTPLPYPMLPITYLMGMGLDSQKRAPNRGSSLLCMALATSKSPDAALETSSDIRPGQQLEATDITPSAPMLISARVRPSSPLRTANPSGLRARICCIWDMLPLASLTPAMPGSSARRMRTSVPMLDPVLPGMLYTIIGMSTAASIAA